MREIEMTATIGRLRDLEDEALAPYDAVYLGDPFCECGADNLLEREADLHEAIRRLKDCGKSVYLSTYVEPWSDTTARLRRTIERSVRWGIDAVEISDLGVLRIVAATWPALAIHISQFIKLFNPQSVGTIAQGRVQRIMPNPELSLDEIDTLREGSSIPLELQVHGKIPLGYTERCVLRSDPPGSATACSGMCYEPYRLEHASGLAMRPAGRVTLAQKDLCMLPHLGTLLRKGYRYFRVETRFESSAYRKAVGLIYREHLTRLLDDEATLSAMNPYGLCNGFYFEQPGMTYV